MANTRLCISFAYDSTIPYGYIYEYGMPLSSFGFHLNGRIFLKLNKSRTAAAATAGECRKCHNAQVQ